MRTTQMTHKCLSLKPLQKGLSPEFRATRLSRRKKRALSSLEGFLLIFLCFRPKGPQKNLHQTLVTSDTRISLVKVLPNHFLCCVKMKLIVSSLRPLLVTEKKQNVTPHLGPVRHYSNMLGLGRGVLGGAP